MPATPKHVIKHVSVQKQYVVGGEYDFWTLNTFYWRVLIPKNAITISTLRTRTMVRRRILL